MRPVIISILLLSFVLSVAAFLRCYSCHGRNNVTCVPEIVNCTKGERCITISEKYKYNKTYCSIYKGCSGGVPCDKKIYGKVNDNLTLGFNIQCCDTDLCNNKFYQMPKLAEPKGLWCPSCLDTNIEKKCETKEKIRCQEIGDECFTFSGTFERPDNTPTNYTIRGCMTFSQCKLNIGRLVGIKVSYQKNYECRAPEEPLINKVKKYGPTSNLLQNQHSTLQN
ncbi:uncharacterized protein [Engystomops pustulosus]|uniref:uncharacterized protein n=1 Tax=Engystomops pustulosus TaxID=76066 RepID=UPI003AFB6EE3